MSSSCTSPFSSSSNQCRCDLVVATTVKWPDVGVEPWCWMQARTLYVTRLTSSVSGLRKCGSFRVLGIMRPVSASPAIPVHVTGTWGFRQTPMEAGQRKHAKLAGHARSCTSGLGSLGSRGIARHLRVGTGAVHSMPPCCLVSQHPVGVGLTRPGCRKSRSSATSCSLWGWGQARRRSPTRDAWPRVAGLRLWHKMPRACVMGCYPKRVQK